MAEAKVPPTPDVEDVLSVGSRVSWGAIFAGGLLALALQFLFTLLGSAVGLTMSTRVSEARLENTAIAWGVFSLCLSLFVGGLVVSQLTVGENKVEAMLYGVIMWGLLLTLVLSLSAAGINGGFGDSLARVARSATTQDWTVSAEEAGVSKTQIEEWRKSLADRQTRDDTTVDSGRTARLTWYVFLGTWASMLAAAGGALVGAGPPVRFVIMRSTP
jgi:hypothetical protein